MYPERCGEKVHFVKDDRGFALAGLHQGCGQVHREIKQVQDHDIERAGALDKRSQLGEGLIKSIVNRAAVMVLLCSKAALAQQRRGQFDHRLRGSTRAAAAAAGFA